MDIKNVKLVIFDMDGLMLDTEQCYYYGVKEMCEKKKIKVDMSVYRAVIGTSGAIDMKKFNKIRDVLDREGIPYKYKVKDRLGDWNGSGTFRGTVGSAGIPADQSKQYEILVEKKDMAQAQNVIKIKLS